MNNDIDVYEFITHSLMWSSSTILCSASTNIVKQSAMRKTALTSAPSTSARAHPYVFLSELHLDICKEQKNISMDQRISR